MVFEVLEVKVEEQGERPFVVHREDLHGKMKGWIGRILQVDPSATQGTWAWLNLLQQYGLAPVKQRRDTTWCKSGSEPKRRSIEVPGKPRKKGPRPARRRKSGEAKGRPSKLPFCLER